MRATRSLNVDFSTLAPPYNPGNAWKFHDPFRRHAGDTRGKFDSTGTVLRENGKWEEGDGDYCQAVSSIALPRADTTE